MKVISIANHKGGVGKTTTTLSLGAGLARQGKRVLLIDLDPQRNLSQGLGVQESDSTIYEALSGKSKPRPVRVSDNLCLIPSSHDLRKIESEFITRIGGQVRLRKVLSDVQGFDYVLIDCPPSLGLLTTNSFSASQEVIVPLTPEYYSVQGMVDLKEAIEEVGDTLNPNLRLSGILITLYNKQKIVHRDVASTIVGMFGEIVFRTRIRSSVAIEEAPYQGQDIFRYAPDSNGAKDYQEVVNEFLERELKCNNVTM